MQDVTEVAGMGWMSVLMDPTGAAIALWKPKKA
jgi:predicted enzyme related to lactoylglutathione lyase